MNLIERLRAAGSANPSGTHPYEGLIDEAADALERYHNALNDLLNDCINFDGGKLSDCYLKQAADVLEGRPVKLERYQWVSVETRLPDEHEEVIITNGENVTAAWFEDYKGGLWHPNPEVIFDVETVTHWMPLPDPPE